MGTGESTLINEPIQRADLFKLIPISNNKIQNKTRLRETVNYALVELHFCIIDQAESNLH